MFENITGQELDAGFEEVDKADARNFLLAKGRLREAARLYYRPGQVENIIESVNSERREEQADELQEARNVLGAEQQMSDIHESIENGEIFVAERENVEEQLDGRIAQLGELRNSNVVTGEHVVTQEYRSDDGEPISYDEALTRQMLEQRGAAERDMIVSLAEKWQRLTTEQKEEFSEWVLETNRLVTENRFSLEPDEGVDALFAGNREGRIIGERITEAIEGRFLGGDADITQEELQLLSREMAMSTTKQYGFREDIGGPIVSYSEQFRSGVEQWRMVHEAESRQAVMDTVETIQFRNLSEEG